MVLRVKNWHKFQHFKDRKPPWIKLYRDILDDLFFHELDGDSAKVLFMIWLIASELDGILPERKELAFRLRMNQKSMNSCISKLSHWLIQDDINTISDIKQISEGYQESRLETETETETETEKYDARAHLLSIEVPDVLIKDWFAIRAKKRLPATKTAITEIVKEIEKSGIKPADAIRECCARGWAGFKASWMTGDGYGKNGSGRGSRSADVIAELTGATRHSSPTTSGTAERVD